MTEEYGDDDATIRVHVFCSFLALVLRKELQNRCTAVGLASKWGDLLRGLDHLQREAAATAPKRRSRPRRNASPVRIS